MFCYIWNQLDRAKLKKNTTKILKVSGSLQQLYMIYVSRDQEEDILTIIIEVMMVHYDTVT